MQHRSDRHLDVQGRECQPLPKLERDAAKTAARVFLRLPSRSLYRASKLYSSITMRFPTRVQETQYDIVRVLSKTLLVLKCFVFADVGLPWLALFHLALHYLITSSLDSLPTLVRYRTNLSTPSIPTVIPGQ